MGLLLGGVVLLLLDVGWVCCWVLGVEDERWLFFWLLSLFGSGCV